jgi:hypothetical protein
MPGSYLIDLESGVVYCRGWGVLTDEEIAAHVQALRADPRFDPGFRQVVDFLKLTDVRLTGAGVREVARYNPFRRDARRAFVVASDEAFGLVRMFGMFTDSNVETFTIVRTLEAAFASIGLPPTTPWPDRAPDSFFGAA